MKKLVSILALLGLAVTACGGSNAVAATVDGTEIMVGDVEDLIDPEGSIIPISQFAQFLGFEIQWEIVEQAANAEWAIVITPEEISAEADRIFATASADETREVFLSGRGVTESFLTNIAHQGLLDIAVRDRLGEEVPLPTQEEIDAEMAVALAGLTEVCVTHILVATQAEALETANRLRSGEDFGALAQELSLDPGSAENSGILPCGSAGQYVAEFRDAAMVAPIGEVFGTPVETTFGFHILLVTDRVDPAEGDLPTADEVSEGLHAQAVGAELNRWFLTRIAGADVFVDPEFGTWEPDNVNAQGQPQPAVVPPAQ